MRLTTIIRIEHLDNGFVLDVSHPPEGDCPDRCTVIAKTRDELLEAVTTAILKINQ